MPSVGTRERKNIGNFSKNSMYAYAKSFCEAKDDIMRESQVDYTADPSTAMRFTSVQDRLKNFFTENSLIGQNYMTAEEKADQLNMMEESYINDVQALREHSAGAGLQNYNPLIGLSLPMHKYLMLNCVFAQAIPRFVAKTPTWTETMETRYMITPDGERIDISNEQNKIYPAWKKVNPSRPVIMTLPEFRSTDILTDVFKKPSDEGGNLSTATRIEQIAIEAPYVAGETTLTINEDGTVEETVATEDGEGLVWKDWIIEFNPNYGEYNRTFVQPIRIQLSEDEKFEDTLTGAQIDNMFEITSIAGKVKAVKMMARFDASTRMMRTPRVEWKERTTFVSIPEADGITIPMTPEEVKDIGALYGINQVTKCMTMIKDVMENVKDDDIKHELDQSFVRLDNDHKLARTIDFAPRPGYYNNHLAWLQETFMNTLDQFITGLLTVLRDPNMEICIIGRPGIISQITPTEYTYTTSDAVGPIQLDFTKTVVTSQKRVYKFISSDKLFNNDNLIVLLIPKNTDRIVYRLYDYQMYISNEIRDFENPALPALTAFQRYKFFEYQPVQGRLFVANPTGLREHLPNVDPIGPQYNNHDLDSVYAHYDAATGKNVYTENVLPEQP